MKRRISARTVLGTAATTVTALVVAGTVTAGVGVASAEHRDARPAYGAGPVAQGREAAEKEVAALFDGWNAALMTGDAEKVADRYAAGAVLLPTASPRIRTDRAGIVDYFEHFLQKKPRGEKIRSVITILDRDSAIDAGLYAFHLTDPKTGERTRLEARYTYAYEKRGGKWLIVNHHSSVLPAGS
ncbi:SgcJ/EcaC family oxidoreductase [Streptomyces sp. NPDC127092]|uniref:SgcJ/EcaC family oxidoreductase n=1 Tax=Streptomyces sp. NPDC127092 TaxID=3347135 RepID=UPI00364F179B